MFNLIIKEIESSTETNSYCTITADSIPDDIITVFGQNAYLYVFGLPVPWEILFHGEMCLSWRIAIEYLDTSCEHVVRYLHRSNSNITSIEITNTIMGINNYQRVLDTLEELNCVYEFINEEIGDINHPQPTENGKPML